ncbi:MAG: IclR family transcriptional regulator [Deltaproteobacteria bacterium]|nr:IclR family transcriptional regulator [Deltaproteobacteria bacterium]
MPDRQKAKTLTNGLNLLILLSRQEAAASLDELTKLSGLSKTVCFRLLATLKELNFVEQDAQTKRYRLGAQNISIGASALNSLSLRNVAMPFMEQLRSLSDETVNMAVLEGTDIVFVARLEASHIINTRHRIGERLPAHCTCQGKAIMAFSPPETLERLLDQIKFRAATVHTITTPQAIKKELALIRRRGIALNAQELEKGLCAVAAPILDYTGYAVASLNIAFPLLRHSQQEATHDFAPAVAKACQEISRMLGCTQPAPFNPSA